MKVMVALAILASAIVSPALADDHSANYYLPGCRDFVNKQFARNPFLQGHCVGIIEGLSVAAPDLVHMIPGRGDLHLPEPAPARFNINQSCVPDSATLAQMTTVVVRWFDQHPERWHEDFRANVLFALHDAWPCQ